MENLIYICAICEGEFETREDEVWSDKKALEELMIVEPESKNRPLATVCDVCYEGYKNWLFQLTPNERRKMDKEAGNVQ